MSEISREVKCMARACTHGLMAKNTKENIKRVKKKAGVSTPGKMEKNMPELGKLANRTDTDISESTKSVKPKKVFGKRESSSCGWKSKMRVQQMTFPRVDLDTIKFEKFRKYFQLP
jgi:hypothetical protein